MTPDGAAPGGDSASNGRQVLHNVQLLRFAAAGAILTSHSADLLFPDDAPIWSVTWVAGVDIFFVISGFIMYYLTRGCFGEPGAARAFLVRRLVRIVPPYWLFTTLMIAAALAFDPYVRNATLAPAQILTSYLFIPWPRGDGQINPLLSLGWTLNFEMFFYLAFAAALLFRRGLLLLAGAFCLLAAVGPWVPEQLVVLRFWSRPLILEFLVGIVLALVYFRGIRLPWWGSLACLAAGLVAPLVLPVDWLGPYFVLATQGVPAALICAGLILLPDPERPGRIGRALRAGGDASYALYLSHPFTVYAVVLVWRPFGADHAWATMALAMAAAIAAAVVIYRAVERPMTDWLQRATGSRPLRGAAAVAP